MKNNAITTLAIGSEYLEIAVAMLVSCRKFLGDNSKYFIFFVNTDIEKFEHIDWISFIEIEEVYKLNGRFKPRRYKHYTLSHESLSEYNVIYLDADVIVYRDCLSELFDILEEKKVLIYGGYRSNDFNWFSGVSGLEKFNLKDEALSIGLSIENISLNSGIVGRSSDTKGLEYSNTLKKLLTELPLPSFNEDAFNNGYFNDEPYYAISYSLVCGIDYGYMLSGVDKYIVTTSNATVKEIDNGFVEVNKNDTVSSPDIVHYVGFKKFDVYNKHKQILLDELHIV